MDLGTTLRGARERRGLSLPELARITKIKIDTLRAIESDAFDRLPGGIFTRGFLRSYAREVGLDPEDAVRRYHDEFEAGSPIVYQQADSVRSPAVTPIALPETSVAYGDPQFTVTRHWGPAVAVLALAVLGYVTFAALRHSDRRPAPAQANAAVEPARPAPSAPPPAPVGTTGATLQIALSAHAPCWITATADGTRKLFKIMQPGEHQTLEIRNELVLRIGDPAALDYSINGAAGRPLGRAGQPVTVRIGPANYREFVAGS